MSTGKTNKSQKQTRVLMVAVLLIILAMVGTLFPVMRHIAKQRQQTGAQSFASYVQQHHLGTLMSIDSGTGIDPVSYVLTMDHRIPDNQIQSQLTLFMKKYVKYDSGETLSIFYENPTTHQRSPVGLASYDEHNHILVLTITPSSGNQRQVSESVNW